MMRNVTSVMLAMVVGVAIFDLAGCGGGGSAMTEQPPSINGFSATPSTIEAGSSSSLTPTFNGGAGVITPGNIAATSGTPVSISPTATTTYTLTVTPASGSAVTATATVTVDPTPTISSFTANPTVIASGSSSSLSATFTGGTGVINPGSITVTSGTAVSVSPTANTTYMLTVTPPVGSVNVTAQTTVTVNGGAVTATVTIDPSTLGPAATDQLLGMNLAAWYDIENNASAIVSAFQGAGIKAVRWPGGSWSDLYHWDGNNVGANFNGAAFNCQNPPFGGGVPDSNDTFQNFVNDIVRPAGLDLALTADYGTNAACSGPGDPSEAAYWIQAAESYGMNVSHMTVGNEVYGSLAWEENLNNPTTVSEAATQYAAAMTGSTGFYSSIAAAGAVQTPPPLIGVVVEADNRPTSGDNNAWDNIVLQNAAGSYDFVEFHYYPQAPGSESDVYLTQQAAQGLTKDINIVKSELAVAGKPNTPIYVGEMGSVYTNPGKQSISITQGLYAGQMLGEMMNDGVSRATWWIGFGNCNGTNGNLSSSLYGWQDFGAYNVFSDGSEDACMPWGTIGTMSPTAAAFQLFSNVAVNGEHVLAPTVAGDTTDVRAYAATHSGGTALVLFNVNETTAQTVEVTLTGKSSSAGVKQYMYDKSIYDLTQTDVWNGPTTTDLGAESLPLTLTLTPWSMNVVIIQ